MPQSKINVVNKNWRIFFGPQIAQMGTDYYACWLCWREFVTRAAKVKEKKGVKSEIELKKSIIDFN